MRQLTDEAIAEVLAANGIGVLAFGETGRYPYAIPVAFGYDADADVFALQLEGGTDSEKHRALERHPYVSVTVFEETEPRETWRSVVVRGKLVETSYEAVETAFATLAKRTRSAPNPVVWGDSGSVTPYELQIEEWSGRSFPIS
ncbi:pyridoxamine 5'-phosphate oxidase family protein [Halomicrobium sp. IBSBa]|uniref:pyridoxamine 5'-phosphate oxidase family protein n=1 Tax=Halomicrobium sp. IBSBa TaxID=2778916 RepID=UPI001ABF548C|nr:pyridoxamine 5'-phosphate oxidase family protein [Halomicrobium sp. IBSBa]MBO4246366.1 pyridoxamine 5'-phosphate oxidase family protein [Halomicrobium sp. IBSBa]